MNYDQLRQDLREAEGVDRMRAHRDYLGSIVAPRVHDDPSGRALSIVGRSINEFAHACISCAEASIERTVLIEMQIDTRDFVGDLHDAYHEATERFESQFNSAVQNAKRLANDLATLIYEFLPHGQRTGLKSGSFGRLFNAFRGDDEDSVTEPKATLRALVVTHGEFFESVVHPYRDEAVEHARPYSDAARGERLTSDDRLDVLRVEADSAASGRQDAEQGALPTDFDPAWAGFVYQGGWDGDGNLLGYSYHVHAHNRMDLTEGQRIEKGDPIAFVTDGGSGHFARFGSHRHVFTSRDLPEMLQEPRDVHFGMPGVGELMHRYLTFAELVLDALGVRKA